MNIILIILFAILSAGSKEKEVNICKKHFYSNLKLDINYLPDSLFGIINPQSRSDSDKTIYRKAFWKENKYQFPASKVENVVLFKYKGHRNILDKDSQYIIDQNAKLSSRVIFPPTKLSQSEISDVLTLINDTANYYRGPYDPIPFVDEYAAFIFFNKEYSIVGHLTLSRRVFILVPWTPNTYGHFGEYEKLDSLISQIEIKHK